MELELVNQNRAALKQPTNAQAQPQAQQMMMTNRNILVPNPGTIPQQSSSHLRHQMPASPSLGQQPQREASILPKVPEGWKAQWNNEYKEW
jgi:hypothetical protein